MNRSNFVSIETIFSKLRRDLRRDGISKSDVIEWTAEALRFIGVNSMYEPAIRFAEVKNYHCEMPSMLHLIIQIARNNQYGTAILEPTDVEIPDQGVLLDINGTPVEGYEIAYYRPYFDLVGEFTIGGVVSARLQPFTPVKLSNHTFFDTLVCKEPQWETIYQSCVDEYTLQDNVIKFSFPTGQVAIAYLRMKLDKNGFPMIPDTQPAITAVTKYITMKLMEIDFYAGRQGSEGRLQKAEMDWQWYCRQAGNEGLMLQGIDEWENLLHQRNYLLPRTNSYQHFFGDLSTPENRKAVR